MNHEKLERTVLLGLPIPRVTISEAVARVEQQVFSGQTHRVATANLDFRTMNLDTATRSCLKVNSIVRHMSSSACPPDHTFYRCCAV